MTPYRHYFTWRAAQDRDAAISAWGEALAGIDEPALVVAAGAPATELRFEDVHASLSSELTAGLTARVRGQGVTLNTALQAAWGLVIGQLTGRRDVVFGTTVSGRPPEIDGIAGMAGLFINTLPVRVRWRDDQPLAMVLAAHQLAQADLLDHQHLGLSEIQRLAGRGDLFDTLLVFENQPPTAAVGRVAGGVEVTGFQTLDCDHYPLAFVATPGERLELLIKHDVDRFTPAQARGILARVVALLEAVVADPSCAAGRVALVGDEERAGLLAAWTGTPLDVSEPTLQAAFEAQVARTPAATAVVDGARALTYAQLDARAEALAGRLRAAGAGPEVVVAVALARCAGLVAGMLAVLKTGAAYVPLDPSHPEGRRAFVLADSGARIVVVSAADRGGLPAVDGLRVVVLDGADGVAPPAGGTPQVATDGGADVDRGRRRAEGDAACEGAEVGPARGGAEGDLAGPATEGATATGEAGPLSAAYCIHTSGSTGTPKGVVVTHGAILSQLAWVQRALPLTVADRVLSKASTSVDVSLLEILWPLLAGAAVVVAPGDAHRDPHALAELVREHGVTVMDFSPSMLDAFLRATEDAPVAPSLRLAFSGGEALHPALAARWHEQTGVALVNAYGPTEATIQVTWHEYAADADGDERVPVGRPVANSGLRILDAGLRPLAPGIAGELYLAGAQLARGYLDRSALTAERFVADPFGAPGERMYRTGDIVRDRGDGAIEYLGRGDDQVKLRGNRIELGEIEARLEREPGVARAVAIVRSDGPGEARLVAYVTAATGVDSADGAPRGGSGDDAARAAGALDGEALRAALAAALPEPMVPAAVVVLDALPLAPSGKVDRAALPAPEAPRASARRVPADDRERLLCAAFAGVLGLDDVGPDEDFFLLGGDSILSISVAIAARKVGLTLAPRDVFRERTPAGLARHAASSAPVAPEPAAADGDGVGALTPLPIVEHLRESGGPIGRFNLSMLLRAPAGASIDELTAVLQAVLDHHDALRLRLTRIAGVLWSLETLAAGALRAADHLRRVAGDPVALSAAVAIESDAAVGRLDPDAGRVLEAVWFDAGPDTPGRLLLAAHHLAVDGVSWRILLGDLARAWDDVRAGRAPALDPVATSLRTFARIAGEQARAPQRLAELDHWRPTLAAGADLIAGAPLDATCAQAVADTIELSVTDSTPLLTSTPAATGADVTELLLAALRIAAGRWQAGARRRRGRRPARRSRAPRP